MARPYELFVRFLVTQGVDDVDSVNSRLEENGLLPIDPDEFDNQFNIVFDNIPKFISEKISNKNYCQDFLKWMKVLDVGELWELERPFVSSQKAGFKLIYDIGLDPKLKITLQALISKSENNKDICQTVNMKYSYGLKEEHVELYKKFFWNHGRMSRKDWRHYLKRCDNNEKSVFFVVLTEDATTVRTLLDLPSKIDITTFYSKIFIQCSQKIQHYMKINSKETNSEARAWINTLLTIGDKVKKYETGDIAEFSKTIQLEFDFAKQEFQTPDENTRLELEQKQQQLINEGE